MPIPSPLNEGQIAPDFSFELNGKEVRLSELNSYSLIYFYPKDDTPGCTIEACGIRDIWSDLQSYGLTVIGISKDPASSHEKFRKKYKLPFSLFPDIDLTISKSYGVFGEKKFMGRVYDSIHRISFLTAPSGEIIKVYPKVKPKDHPTEVLDDLKKLKIKN